MNGIMIPIAGLGDEDASDVAPPPPSWREIAEKFNRTHGERLSTTQAKRLHDVAVWKIRAALGIVWGMPLRKQIEKHGIDMSALETAST